MKKEFSIYLDLTRFLAALAVVIYHSNMRNIIAEPLSWSGHGHAAVMVFFVLSGYVISYITVARENNPIDYWSSRLSRFYSLALPVVLMAPLLDAVGESLAPQFYEGKTTHDLAWLRILTSLMFANEWWKQSIMSFSNVPYWSLCYEMWYYVLFGIFAFTQGRTRLLLAAGVMLLVGPKILLLLPVWVLGVALHRSDALARLPEWKCWALFLASWPLYALFHHYQLSEWASATLKELVGPVWHREAAFSRYFLTDYLLALIIAANFVGFRGIAHRFAAPLRLAERPIRWVASFTFSLYIFHQPLLQFYAALINGDPRQPWFYSAVMAATFATVVVLGYLLERKRDGWRRAFHALLSSLTRARWWPGATPGGANA
ncbi:MAG: acyltransferase family protein [Gammaproteobacteria bacterium]